MAFLPLVQHVWVCSAAEKQRPLFSLQTLKTLLWLQTFKKKYHGTIQTITEFILEPVTACASIEYMTMRIRGFRGLCKKKRFEVMKRIKHVNGIHCRN